MTWVQENPKGSGRFYLYQKDSAGKNLYLRTASQSQIKEHQFGQMFKEKMVGGESNEKIVKSIFASMTAKSKTIEEEVGKEVTITKKGEHGLTVEVDGSSSSVQFGGGVFFRQDKDENWIAIADPSRKVDGKSKEVFMTFSKQFFLIDEGVQEIIINELHRSLNTKGLNISNVNKQFKDDIGKDVELFGEEAYR